MDHTPHIFLLSHNICIISHIPHTFPRIFIIFLKIFIFSYVFLCQFSDSFIFSHIYYYISYMFYLSHYFILSLIIFCTLFHIFCIISYIFLYFLSHSSCRFSQILYLFHVKYLPEILCPYMDLL